LHPRFGFRVKNTIFAPLKTKAQASCIMEENKDLSTPAEETSAEASTSVDQPDMAPISEETTAPKSETETSDKEEVETSRTETEKQARSGG
jgi:hypothetical protein